MTDFDNERNRFGSAGFAGGDDPGLRAAFNKTPDSLFVGYLENRPLYWNGMGGALLVAGARGGKLTTILANNTLDTMYAGTLLILDMKGELAAISRNLTRSGKHAIYWSPMPMHGLPQHRMNPVDYIHIDSPTLVSDIKVFAENMVPSSGSSNAEYFERRAREILEAIALTITELDGVLTLPRLYEMICLIAMNNDDWLSFAFEMSESQFDIARRIEAEIADSRGGEGAGMKGILGELFKAVSCLSDPVLMASVSPPYDFSLKQLCESDQAYQVYLMPPAEFVESWAPIIKAILVGAMIYKSRAPSAPRQTWLLDECAILHSFPLVIKLFSYGAGIGVRPFCVYQSTMQMERTGKGAKVIISSSAAVQIYFAIRDGQSATDLSRMIGQETLTYDDTLAQSASNMQKKEAIQALLGGATPMEVAHRLSHHSDATRHRSQQQRWLRTSDEILRTPADKAYVFMDGVRGVIYADRKPYYEQRSMAGLFHPNPYHPPLDKVRVKTRFGYRWRQIINEPVPQHFAHLPQHKDGTWSYVEGY